jgi:hypothetical protein
MAAAASSDTDPLGISSQISRYAGLNAADRQDPSTGDPAIIHTAAFKQGLEAQIDDWMMFDQAGQPLPDPDIGYSVIPAR